MEQDNALIINNQFLKTHFYMMKQTNQWMLAAILTLCGSLTTQAQTAESGKTVKRITFDRERVTLVYSDGTKAENVQKAVIKAKGNDEQGTATGIARVKAGSVAQRTWYTMDGRRLQGEPRVQGVYVVKEGDKVRKIIKK